VDGTRIVKVRNEEKSVHGCVCVRDDHSRGGTIDGCSHRLIDYPKIYTNSRPFADYTNDVQVMITIARGVRPSRPDLEGIQMYRELWTLINKCWDPNPDERPSVREVADNVSERFLPRESLAHSPFLSRRYSSTLFLLSEREVFSPSLPRQHLDRVSIHF
jgi:hypothetical protein